MAAQTGRTVSKWVDFRIDDNGGTLRSIPVSAINGVGLAYDETDVTAFQDAIKNVLPGHPDLVISITGPFDNSVVAAAGTLSGSHTVLKDIDGGVVPLSMDIQIGIRHAWEAGEPQFGISASATSGMICTAYNFDPGAGTYTAQFRVMGGIAPAWGTAAET